MEKRSAFRKTIKCSGIIKKHAIILIGILASKKSTYYHCKMELKIGQEHREWGALLQEPSRADRIGDKG